MSGAYDKHWADVPLRPRAWPFYYGWMIVACTSISIIASIPGQTIGVGVFVDFLVGAMRLSRDNLSTAYLLGTLASSITMPFAGRLLDRWGTRIMGMASSVGLGLSLLGFALCDWLSPGGDVAWLRAMTTICVLFFCVRFFGQGLLTLVGRVMLARWFNYRRGLATSISSIFVSVAFTGGGAWILNEMTVQLGWRNAYLMQFILIGVVHALFAAVFFRDNPEQCGLPQDGIGYTPTKTQSKQANTEAPSMDTLQACRTLAFWAFNLGLAAHALMMTAMAFHLTSIGAEMGLDRQAAYLVLLPMPVFSISGSFLCGYLCDRYDQKWSLALMMLCLAVGTSGLLNMNMHLGKGMVMIGLGVSGGCFGVLSTVVWPRYFGRQYLGAINGASMFLVVFASALGPKFFSMVHRYSGDFELVLILSRAMPLFIVLLAVFIPRPRRAP